MQSNIHTLPARHAGHHAVCQPARRFVPLHGRLLTLANIRGPWRPSGAAGGSGVFAVRWSTYCGDYWAPLHDFEPADQLRLIEACRRLDLDAGFPPAGRRP